MSSIYVKLDLKITNNSINSLLHEIIQIPGLVPVLGTRHCITEMCNVTTYAYCTMVKAVYTV